MFLGVIADDFTGGTDIASFLVKEGMATVQMIGVPQDEALCEQCAHADAVVVSLKSRSIPAPEAIAASLDALHFLQRCGAQQIFFKYCSTFDSTAEGNIGPVAGALMQELQCPFTVFSPALPVNGRSVFNGYLFVKGELLSESPMKNHPLNPMHDSYIPRLVDMQAQGNNLKCGVISHDVLQGDDATRQVWQSIKALQAKGYNCAAVDAVDDHDLYAQGQALLDMKLVTGGSGLGMGLARAHLARAAAQGACKACAGAGAAKAGAATATAKGEPIAARTIVLSGSCSAMTNTQVANYKTQASAWPVEVEKCVGSEEDIKAYVDSVAAWCEEHKDEALPPLVYATAAPEKLHQIQAQYGASAAAGAIEHFFFLLSAKLKTLGVRKFVVAGGETSGQVTKALGVSGFYIGPTIAPGVPWVRALNEELSLALKSGNFGDEQFFFKAVEA